jgi:anti-sigma factor RsiW
MSIEEHMLNDLLGAYALDAIDDEERIAVEEYLRVSPAAAAEVREHREVASILAWSAAPAPAGLWEKIAGSLDGEGPAPAPSGELARVLPLKSRRRRIAVTAGLWVASAAAAAALAVVTVRAIDGGSQQAPLAKAFDEAKADRESVSTTLVSESGEATAAAVVDVRGHGYIDASALPMLGAGETYQLWGVIDDKVISLGVLGRHPDIEPFAVDGQLTALVITRELAGAVVSDGNPDGAYVGAIG